VRTKRTYLKKTYLKKTSPELALARVQDALGQELIDASDEEILQVATDLRMNLEEKMSAAYAGLKYPARPKLADFFDVDVARKMRDEVEKMREETSSRITTSTGRRLERSASKRKPRKLPPEPH
jgi:hypothetical protein